MIISQYGPLNHQTIKPSNHQTFGSSTFELQLKCVTTPASIPFPLSCSPDSPDRYIDSPSRHSRHEKPVTPISKQNKTYFFHDSFVPARSVLPSLVQLSISRQVDSCAATCPRISSMDRRAKNSSAPTRCKVHESPAPLCASDRTAAATAMP